MKPDINVTPLIDVLLVLLIIFMVIAPLKPSQFETRIPAEPKNPTPAQPHINTLIVKINADTSLELNTEKELGTIKEPEKLSQKLNQIFTQRLENRVLNEDFAQKNELSLKDKIQKTVFIKAPKSIAYGEVVKVIDEVKSVGANPISLQIDDLEK